MCDFHDREGTRTIYFSSRAVLPCKPNKEPRTSGPHTVATSIFPDHKAHRETRLVHTLAAFNSDPNNKRNPNDRARGRTVCMTVWPVRKQTAAAGISAFIPAAGQFTSRKRIRLSVAQLLLRLDQQTSTGSQCHRSFSLMRRHVTFSVYYRKGLHKQLTFLVNLNTDSFFHIQADLV